MSKSGPDFEKISICPHCGHRIDTGLCSPAYEDAHTAKPTEGDFGVCIECGGFMVYTDSQGTLRAMEPNDYANAGPELQDELIEIRRTILRHKK